MPYINKDARYKLRRFDLGMLLPDYPLEVGELNYLITTLINHYIKQRRRLSYSVINDIMGVLESSKLEFYNRVAAPYEKKKLKENGDVYDFQIEKVELKITDAK